MIATTIYFNKWKLWKDYCLTKWDGDVTGEKHDGKTDEECFSGCIQSWQVNFNLY